jgi:exosortase/archaeosortase family protein
MGKKKNEKLKKILFFLIKFNLLAIPLYLILIFNLSFQPFQNFVATLTTISLKSLGYRVAQDGFTLAIFHSNKLSQLEISWDSTGWKSLYALFALVFATSGDLRKKIKFLIIALPTLFLINILRIVSTIVFALEFGFEYFDLIHLFLWREGLIFFVILFWFIWAKSIILRKK